MDDKLEITETSSNEVKIDRTHGKQSTVKKASKARRFEASAHNKQLSNWIMDSLQDFNAELKSDLPALRVRSRDAAINDVYARSYFDALKCNVIGSDGIQLTMGVVGTRGKPDVRANTLISDAWEQYTKEVTTDGMNLRQALNLYIESVAKDGEVFIVIRRGEEFGKSKIQLQFFEAEFCDLTFDGKAKNGNLIRSGIEYNEFGKATAYYLFKNAPRATNAFNSSVNQNKDRIRFDAKDVIHGHDRERIGQGRGFPWLASALVNLTHIREYQKSELVAARVASAKMGFFTRPRGEDDVGDIEDPNDANAFLQEAEPGMFDILPEGYGLETFDPQNPNANFNQFVKKILQGIAASVGLAYHTISNDLESTSYSSLRQGAIDERDTYRGHQQFVIDTLLTKLFDEWLGLQLAFKNLGGATGLQLNSFDKFNKPIWKTKVWQWIDPAKETAALKMQLDYNLRSRQDIARGLGMDYDDTLREIKQEQEFAAELDINLGIVAPTVAVDVAVDADDVDNDDSSSNQPENTEE